MKKLNNVILMAVLVLFSVVSVSASAWNFDDIGSGSTYMPTKMIGDYKSGHWVQYNDDKATLYTFLNKGYSHNPRMRHHVIVDAVQTHVFLCESWKLNGKCQYTVDPLGKIRYVYADSVVSEEVAIR